MEKDASEKPYLHQKRPERPPGWLPPNKRPQKPKPRYVRPEFSFDTIHGLSLKETECYVPTKAEREAARLEFDGQFSADGKTLVKEGMRAKFLKHLAEKHAKELKENLGLDDGQISQMAERGRVPNGFNVHHKLPLHVGGKNEFSNFILIPLYPHDQLHRDILDKQIENMKEGERRTILLPACEDMVYDPKKYGYMKNNQKVEPNYESRVDVAKYSDNYLPEHIAEIRSKREKTEKPKVISLFKTLKEISESGKAAALLPERVAAVPPPPPAVQKKISEKGRG